MEACYALGIVTIFILWVSSDGYKLFIWRQLPTSTRQKNILTTRTTAGCVVGDQYFGRKCSHRNVYFLYPKSLQPAEKQTVSKLRVSTILAAQQHGCIIIRRGTELN